MIYIVTDFRGSYHRVVDKLCDEAGAELVELAPHRKLDRGISKRDIVRQWVTPRLVGLRDRWGPEDVVLVIGWYLIPVLLLMRVGLLSRPRRIVSMATFVHDERLRRAANLVLRALNTRGLEFIVFSDAERRNLIHAMRVEAANVHRVVYRDVFDESGPRDDPVGDYVFTGGYSNRDYETFFAAVSRLDADVVAVASGLNDAGVPPSNVTLRQDIPWDEFERLIAGCALLVLPLREGGEACGQNVLFRGIRHGRPVVATRHDSLVDYLGDDYPGFVPAGDARALRNAIERGLHDGGFRRALIDRVGASSRRLRQEQRVEVEIADILLT